jgi:succinoglycan biosynthesis protein ExoO
MVMGEKVSVIMPAYNAEAYVQGAIDSVIAQTYQNIELIVIDDGSTDSTFSIVDSYSDDRIKCIRNLTNRGAGAARDYAISMSEGAWIAIIDADDLWARDRVEKLMSLLATSDIPCMLIDNIFMCYEQHGNLVPWKLSWKKSDTLLQAGAGALADYLRKPHHLIKPIFPRWVVQKFRVRHTNTVYAEDAEFFIRLMKLGGLSIRAYPEALYYYRLTPGTMSSSSQRHLLKQQMFERLRNELNFTNEEKAAIDSQIRHLSREIRYASFLYAIKVGDYYDLLKMLLKNPWFLLKFLKRAPETVIFRTRVMLSGGRAR